MRAYADIRKCLCMYELTVTFLENKYPVIFGIIDKVYGAVSGDRMTAADLVCHDIPV